MTHRSFKRLKNNADARLFVALDRFKKLFNGFGCVNERNSAASNNAFLNGGLCRSESVLDTEFFLLHFDFGSGTYADNGYAARKLSKAFL